MKHIRHYVISGLTLALSLTACSAVPDNPAKNSTPSLSQTLASEDIISLPYKTYGRGLFSVNMTSHTGETLPFLIDTGATRSAIFRSTQRKLGLEADTKETVTIHGMAAQKVKPVVFIPTISLGHKQYENYKMAVLADRKNAMDMSIIPAGLIGMDILSQYRVYVNAHEKTFNLIPKSVPAPRIPGNWRLVPLQKNPFIEQDHNLHFLEIRLGNHLLPALLDTGSEANIMSWSVEKYPTLKRAKSKIRNQWLINGAVGTFDPVSKINVKNLRAGQKYWQKREFLIMNFNNLEILGVKDQPFVIAGAGLLADATFYLDFENDRLLIKPHEGDANDPNYRCTQQELGVRETDRRAYSIGVTQKKCTRQ